MKKIARKLGKQRLLLLGTLAVILGIGVTGATLLPSKPEQSMQSSERIAIEQTTDTTKEQSHKEVAATTIATPEPVEQSDTTTQQQSSTTVTPEKNVYEKYGVSQSIAQQFEAYYPTYTAYNKDLFVSNIATIVSVVGENNAEKFLDNHARTTGIKGRTDGNKDAEKNSFLRLIIGGGGYSFNLSWEPWSQV